MEAQKISKKKALVTAAVVGILILLVSAVIVGAILSVPSNHIVSPNPLPTATPTPKPTASPTASPSPTAKPNVVGAVLTANDTDSQGHYIFLKGNTLHLVATLNSTQSGLEVDLINNEALIATATTTTTGIVTFDRVVNNPYNYYVNVINP